MCCQTSSMTSPGMRFQQFDTGYGSYTTCPRPTRLLGPKGRLRAYFVCDYHPSRSHPISHGWPLSTRRSRRPWPAGDTSWNGIMSNGRGQIRFWWRRSRTAPQHCRRHTVSRPRTIPCPPIAGPAHPCAGLVAGNGHVGRGRALCTTRIDSPQGHGTRRGAVSEREQCGAPGEAVARLPKLTGLDKDHPSSNLRRARSTFLRGT
jgi:hypothetical protein